MPACVACYKEALKGGASSNLFPEDCETPSRQIHEDKMRTLVLAATFSALFMTSASAEWMQHVYADKHFAVSFPADPKVSTTPYTASDGTKTTRVTYTARQDDGLYEASYIDLTNSKIDAAAAIDQVVKDLSSKGEVSYNQAARQNGTCGRYITLKGKDGSSTTNSIFFRDNKLYHMQGTSLPMKGADSTSGYLILFTNSFTFDITLPFRGDCFGTPADFFTNRNPGTTLGGGRGDAPDNGPRRNF